MAILTCVPLTVGAVGVNPRGWSILTDDTFAEVTTAGYLTNEQSSYGFLSTDYAEVYTTDSKTVHCSISVSATGVVSLINNATFINGSVSANYVAAFDGSGGIKAGGAPVVNPLGGFQAGVSGVVGSFSSVAPTASSGIFVFRCSDNSQNVSVSLTNASFGQSTVLTIPNPASATANIVTSPAALVDGNLVKASGTAGLVADAAFNIKSAVTAAYAGGGTSNAFTATGLTASSIVVATIKTSTNNVSVTKAVPGTNTLTITFSADPGAATTVQWIATSAAVA